MSKLRAYQAKAAANKETTAGAWGNGILDSDGAADGLIVFFEILLGKKAADKVDINNTSSMAKILKENVDWDFKNTYQYENS